MKVKWPKGHWSLNYLSSYIILSGVLPERQTRLGTKVSQFELQETESVDPPLWKFGKEQARHVAMTGSTTNFVPAVRTLPEHHLFHQDRAVRNVS